MSNDTSMETLVDTFVEKYCKTDAEKFKTDIIELIAECQKLLVVYSVSNSVGGKNLHSEYNSIMKEFKELKTQIKYMKDSEEAFKISVEKSNTELKTQLESSKKPSSKEPSPKASANGSTKAPAKGYGVFSSKIAKEFAEENNITGENVEGTGKNNKITKSDIQKYLGISTKSSPKTSAKTSAKTKTDKICKGISVKGAPCNSCGTVFVKGIWYCKKHQEQAVKTVKDESEEEYSDDESSANNIKKFRENSLKSVENMDSDDEKLNRLMDNSDCESVCKSECGSEVGSVNEEEEYENDD